MAKKKVYDEDFKKMIVELYENKKRINSEAFYAISEIDQFKKKFIILCGVFHTISEKRLKYKRKYYKNS